MTLQPTYDPYHQPECEKKIAGIGGVGGMVLDDKGKNELLRKPIVRRTIDYHSSIIHWLENRHFKRTYRDFKKLYPSSDIIKNLNPMPFEKCEIAQGFCTKFVSTSVNKHKCAVNCLVVK